VKHWAMAVYQDEAQYDFATRNIPQTWWTYMYRDILNDFNESARIINADPLLTAEVKANQLAIVDVMQVYVYNLLVNTFGDIPYTEAFNPAILFPKYDDAKTIQLDLLKRLATDVSKLTAANSSFTANDDIVYKGSTEKWLKFANSLRMRIGMTIADVDDATAKTTVEAADPNVFSSVSDNGSVVYLPASPNNNPLYIDIVQGNRGDYVAAKDLLDTLNFLADPRKQLFFGTNNEGKYVGGVVGTVNTYADVSKPNGKLYAADAPVVLLDFVETEFFRAEAKERGYNVSGTAADHYSNAIRASIIWWGGTAADADAYLAKPEVAYATAAGSFKQKIGFQKWIGLYNRPVEGWTEYRRLDYPKLPLAVNAKSGYPNRLQYPNNEQQLNGTNYTAAAAKIGTDKVETKLYWDKF